MTEEIVQDNKLGVSTLGERGPLLPIGVADPGGGLHREIEIRGWTGKTMRELGKLREDSSQMKMTDHVGLVMSVLATRIGSYDFANLSRREQKLAISTMYMGDVFYVYCYARLKSLGSALVIDLTCPACRNKFVFEGDLNSLPVKTAETIESTSWEYDLLDPITLRGDLVTKLVMGPAQWLHVEGANVEGNLDMEGAKLSLIAGSVKGVPGRTQFPFSEAEIDELSGRDIEQMLALIDEHFIGPELKLEVECPNKRCKSKIVQPLNWTYPDFFGASSRSRTGGNSTTGSLRSLTFQTVG
jgi:hypothetical protein